MITQFKIHEMIEKRKKIDILKFNYIYQGQFITIKVPRRVNRQIASKEEIYIIDKISYKEPNIYDKDRRNGSLIISLKGRVKREIEITKTIICFLEEFEKPKNISYLDDTIETIVNIYRSL